MCITVTVTLECCSAIHRHHRLKGDIRKQILANGKQIQAIYVWSILYFIMRVSANCDVEEIKTNDCTITVKSSGETTEILSETYTEPLLSSNGCPSDSIYQVDLPQIGDEGKEKRGRNPFHYPDSGSKSSKSLPNLPPPGLRGSGVGASLIVGIIVIRTILLPASGILVVKAASYIGVVESDSFYQFTPLLQYAIPPAVNIGTISQMLGSGEREFSVLMLWNYVVAAFSLTLWTAFYMWLVT
ncbi:Membrane transport protein - like 6 [Theobroma cacao]|nr:Membrane transport protein - like 6 [Theobroma cacao]